MNDIKPAGWIFTGSVFLLTLLPVLAGVYILLPVLLGSGVTFFTGYLICFQITPFIFIFLLSIILYKAEGNPMTWGAFKKRMRLRADYKTAAAGLGLLVFGLVTYLCLQGVTAGLTKLSLFAPPDWFAPDLHPLKRGAAGTFMGTAVTGEFRFPALYLAGWFFNIAGEELLFRGYLMPRMELRFAGRAWLVNGFCWWVWHVFWRWQLAALLPFIFLLPFVAQRTRSTIPGIIAHGTMNFTGIIVVTLAVCGVR